MESINLNLIPQGANPIVHAKQFDEGRGFRFNLFNGTAPIVLTGAETITCNVKKPDGNLVTVAVTNTSSNYVEVYTTLQMCACYGANLGEIRLEEDGNDIGTLNFTLSVEESPLNNGIESESSIHNLESMVDGMVAEEVATQYDSSNVIFDNEPTDTHGIGYTVTSKGIKTAIDNAFDYDNTASGSLVHITDGADNIPVKSLVSEITAVESGNGQPKSPDNPYTISGFDNGVVSVCGVNVWDEQWEQGTIDSSGNDFASTVSMRSKGYMSVFPNVEYKFVCTNASTEIRFIFFYDSSKTFISLVSTTSGQYTFTTPNNAYFVKFAFNYYIRDYGSYQNDISINYPSSDTQYHAYNGNTYIFTFGQTVYGGHFDNKGNLVVTHKVVDLGSLNWGDDALHISGNVSDMLSGNYASDLSSYSCEQFVAKQRYVGWGSLVDGEFGINGQTIRCKWSPSTTGAEFKTLVTGCKFKYPLANPITLAITSQDIPTLLGENNIFSNCGDVEVNYYTSKSNDILEFIDSEIGKKNGTNIPIEANSQDSIKDYIDGEVSTINTSLAEKANKTEDTTITVASGYTLISSCCGKTDRLVHLNFNVEKSGGFATGWQVIGTTEFKPNTLAYCPLWNVTNGVGNGEVRIDTDGTINFYIVTAGELRLNANIGYVTD